MNVVALLSFYDEQPGMLAETIATLEGLADHVVACDGAYALFPNGQARSDQGHDAIRDACQAAGLGLTLHVPETTWSGGEIAKRDFMFRLGEQHTTEQDWFFVVDADMVVSSAWGAREQLAGTDLLAGEVCLIDSDGTIRPHRMFFRALRNIRVRNTHYQWAVEPDGPVMWDFHRPSVPSLDLTSVVLVDHIDDRRLEARDIARWGYYRTRTEEAAEVPSVQPGFDYGRDGPQRTLFGRRAGRTRTVSEASELARAQARMAVRKPA